MMHLQKGILLLICVFAAGNAQPVLFETALSPRIANYDIDVTLDTEKNLLKGEQVLYWYNKSNTAASELRFHMYLNAFRNNQSTFLQYSRKKRDKKGWGYIEIDSLWDMNGRMLTDRLEYIQPDDNNIYDKTVMRLPLQRLVQPGEKLTLYTHFTAKLPHPPIARTGAADEFYMVAQWFPKIGVFEDGEWNCHQFHRHSEFFADFGVYNVRITVPQDWIVGATGVRVDTVKNADSTATHFYHAEDVHDFAWTTSPDYVEFTGRADDVNIRVLMQPEHRGQGKRYMRAAQIAVNTFQDWYGDYPYPNLTVVDPKPDAMRAGGMEYPTLITALTFYGLPKGLFFPEQVVIHEFGHNYWYGLVASNEFEESWLDEGINSYVESKVMNEHFGESTSFVDLGDLHIGELDYHRTSYLRSKDYDPTVRKAWEYYSGSSYGANSYSKPVIFLTTLENYLGKDVMRRILQTYFEAYKFKHAKTRDFINVANRVSGQELDWFFDQALFTNRVLDYGVSYIWSGKAKSKYGYDFTYEIEPDTVEQENKKTASADTALKDTTQRLFVSADSGVNMRIDSNITVQGAQIDSVEPVQADTTFYHTVVKVRRYGDFIFPVELQMVFADSDTVVEYWDGKSLWKRYEYTRPNKLISATVDPQQKIVLDVNMTNNGMLIEESKSGIRKVGGRLLFWMQFMLQIPALLNL